MDFIAKIIAAIKAKGANAFTDDEIEALLGEESEVYTEILAYVDTEKAEATAGLVKKNAQILGEKKKLQEQLKAGGDTATVELQAALDKVTEELEETRQSLASKTKEYDKLTGVYQKDKKSLSDNLATERSGYNTLLIDNEIERGFADVQINAAQLKVLKRDMRNSLIIVEEEGKRKAVAHYNDADGKEVQMAFPDYIKTVWSATDDGKAFIVSKAKGSGDGFISKGASGSDTSKRAKAPMGQEDAEDEPFTDLFSDHRGA